MLTTLETTPLVSTCGYPRVGNPQNSFHSYTNSPFVKYDKKRRVLQDELEERERAFKKQKMDKASEERARAQENERIMEQGRRMREERMEAVRKQVDGDAKTDTVCRRRSPLFNLIHHNVLRNLDTTIKIKYSLSSHPSLASAASLAALLEQFGFIDAESIVLPLEPPKKAPTKPPKSGVALVPFRQIGDTFAAVCTSRSSDRGLEGVEICWAECREPPILGWWRKQGKLDTLKAKSEFEGASDNAPLRINQSDSLFAKRQIQMVRSEISSRFRLRIMQLQHAKRERLEREIREQEAIEGT